MTFALGAIGTAVWVARTRDSGTKKPHLALKRRPAPPTADGARPTLHSTPPGANRIHVYVVGAGIIGLCAAEELASRGYSVTIVSDVWTPNTVSDVAGAYWERRTDAHARLATPTMRAYIEIVARGEGEAAGVAFSPGVTLYNELSDPYLAFREDTDALGPFTWLSKEALAVVNNRSGDAFGGKPFLRGIEYTAPFIDSPVHLAWRMRRLAAAGVRFVHATVSDISDLAPHAHVVVNATGFRARELANDPDVHAYRGQVTRVYAPHITRFSTSPSGRGDGTTTYVLPRPGGVVVCGGTYQRDREFEGVDEEDHAALWARCVALEPALLDPSVVHLDRVAGLRPGRDGDVRIELDLDGPVVVVHAYGHGGCGHSLSVGTAVELADLVDTAADALLVDDAYGSPDAPLSPASGPASWGGVLPGGGKGALKQVTPLEGPAPVIRGNVMTLLPQLTIQLKAVVAAGKASK